MNSARRSSPPEKEGAGDDVPAPEEFLLFVAIRAHFTPFACARRHRLKAAALYHVGAGIFILRFKNPYRFSCGSSGIPTVALADTIKIDKRQ
jgi:hypothetical protein